jgi:hypothetical protein
MIRQIVTFTKSPGLSVVACARWFAGRYLLLTIMICCVALNASASDQPLGGVAIHLLRPGTASVADLDGDHIPDVASGIRTGHTREGYSYRVDLDLSSNPYARPFSIFSEEPSGLTIEAIDVDGDRNLDLVIRSSLSLRPVGIWLNDGTGHFRPGVFDAYALPKPQTERFFESHASRPVVHLECRRPQWILVRPRMRLGTPSVLLRELHCLPGGPYHSSFDTARLRAPPVLNRTTISV